MPTSSSSLLGAEHLPEGRAWLGRRGLYGSWGVNLPLKEVGPLQEWTEANFSQCAPVSPDPGVWRWVQPEDRQQGLAGSPWDTTGATGYEWK